jgi:hypothetical protein
MDDVIANKLEQRLGRLHAKKFIQVRGKLGAATA